MLGRSARGIGAFSKSTGYRSGCFKDWARFRKLPGLVRRPHDISCGSHEPSRQTVPKPGKESAGRSEVYQGRSSNEPGGMSGSITATKYPDFRLLRGGRVPPFG